MAFGKNRVQFKDFFWTYYNYEDYDVYFYLGGKELALYTAKYVDEHLGEIEDKLDTGLDDKMQFVIYNTLTDLKQSNIGLLQNESYNTGGVTHIVGKKVFLYYDGTHENLDKQIRAGIAQTLVNQLLYGSSIGSQIKNTSLFPFPDWYLNGLVSYVSEEWNPEIDGHVKDGILSGRFDKFNRLSGEEATYAGHAFWKYIADKYGESSISNIIYMAKVSRRLESGFLYILGISYKNLVSETLAHYKDIYNESDEGREFPEETILKRTKDDVVYSKVKISPDGNTALYTYNRSGKYKVFLQDLNSGKKKKLLKSGYRLDEKIDYSYPLVAWHPSGKIIAIHVEKKGEPVMYYYLMDEKKFEKVVLYQFEKILDFSYSDDGRSLLMSAVQKGQTDIFIYYPGSNSFDQITKDHYDDLYPRFLNNSKEIIFSSNRSNDTLRLERKYKMEEVQKKYDLFLYKPGQTTNILRRVTKTPLANETQAMEYQKGYITYLSDQNGIYNRYLGWFDSTISYVDTTTHYRYFTNSFPISNFSRNVLEHDFVPEAMKYSQVVYKDKMYKLQVYDQLPVTSLAPVSLDNTKFQEAQVNLFGTKTIRITNDEGEVVKPAGTKRRGFSTVRQSQAVKEYMQADSVNKSKGFDINNYEFGSGNEDKKEIDWNFTTINAPVPGQKDPNEEPKRLNYNVEYFINEIVSQIDFSFLNQTYQPFTGGSSPIFLNPGFNALFKVGVTDLLEDYRITGGVRLNLNLANNEYLFSYANLKKRVDKEIIFHRQAIENSTDQGYIYRVYSHEIYYIVKYPFNRIMALKGTASFRNDNAVFLSLDIPSLQEPNFYRNWVGGKGEFIYDDTKNLGVNLFHGTRFKLFGEYYQLVDEKGENLVVLGFDFRNYQRIHRVLIWANRFAISTSFGNNRLIYYMGGVDNWLIPRFTTSTPVDRSQNYAYQTLATNMRGFPQNIRNGNSFAVFNSEVRFPVFRYFANTPIKSDFLNNFQVVGFGDIGTAWTGLHPYSDDNYLFTNKIQQAPLNITVKVQKDPVVGGFGFGARTRLLGYFIRADIAWGVEDLKIVTPSVFYLSLSLDF
ncbi:MAG: hypothetical protein K9G76_10105 [Bacteroidales bacterium]|nr:hypothetical protein [Bacteroidales bacterium]MCF8404053.1 hypothetical protein [Bacteroidales bacterium]